MGYTNRMLTKALVWIAIGLFVGKIVFRRQFKGLGKQLDRLVNVAIIAFLLSYVLLGVMQCNDLSF